MNRTICVLAMILVESICFSQSKLHLDHWPVPGDRFYQGFLTPVSGERLDFLQNLQDNSVALLVRATDGKSEMEFEGESMSPGSSGFITYIWEMAIAHNTGDAGQKATFDLSVNDVPLFTFTAIGDEADVNWIVRNTDRTSLAFIESVREKKSGDVFGYMFLTINSDELEESQPTRIKITGKNHGSQDWYMAFQNVVKPGATAEILPALKDVSSRLKQPLEIEFTHLGMNTSAELRIDGAGDRIEVTPGLNQYTHYLNPVSSEENRKIELLVDDQHYEYNLSQRPVRKFEVYFLPHSHVDIGFTHRQAEVERMQWRNFEQGIELAERTADYPEEARYKWNVEVMWAVDSYLEQQDEEKKTKLVEAVENGWIGLDALIGSELTGIQRAEELMHITDAALDFEERYGVSVNSAMITDVPGYSWGIVPALVENGVKYFSIGPNHMPHLANGGYQVGNTFNAWADIPFYWTSPSGQDKVLFWMSGHGYSWFHDWLLGTLDKSGGTPVLKFLNELEMDGYPYDIVQLRYTMGDNAGPDQGMPDFVLKWNEEYAWPKFRIATTSKLFKDFEERYSQQIPEFSGDFSPYWEDGAASSANETALNRNAADKLVQAEALWAMLRRPVDFPGDLARQAWKNVLLFSEHTWGAISSKSDPDSEFTLDQWKVKQGFALKADSLSDLMLKSVFKSLDVDQSMSFSVYNTNSWSRSDLVTVPFEFNFRTMQVVDESDSVVTTQKLSSGEVVFIAENIPPYSSKTYRLAPSSKHMDRISGRKTGFEMWSENMVVGVGHNGRINEIRLTGLNHNFVDGESEFGFNEYWYTGLNAKDPKSSQNSRVNWLESGPVLDEVLVESEGAGAESITRKIRLVKGLDRIDIENTVDKTKVLDDENVRYSFPIRIDNFDIRLDQAFFILQPDINQLKGANKNFFCAQHFVDYSNSEMGICISNVDVPLVEIGGMIGQDWMKDMRNRPWLDQHIHSPTWFSWVMNNAWFVNYKGHQEGPVTSRYRIKPYRNWKDVERKKFGIESSQPLIVVPGSSPEKSRDNMLNLIGSDDVMITSIRPTRDGAGVLVKLLNVSETASTISLDWKHQRDMFYSDNKESKMEEVKGDLHFEPWRLYIIRAE